MADRVDRGRWYPEMPPMLSGESIEQYTDRLTGADGTDRRPYDHHRNRQCSIGYHGECSVRDPARYGGRGRHRLRGAAGVRRQHPYVSPSVIVRDGKDETTMPTEGMRKRAREWLYNADHPNECASDAEVDDLATLLDEVRDAALNESATECDEWVQVFGGAGTERGWTAAAMASEIRALLSSPPT